MAIIPAKRKAVLDEHIKAESEHDLEVLMDGFTEDCFNDVNFLPDRFDGPERVAERYEKMWESFPDFQVRIKHVLASDENNVVTENEWTGTHRGTFLGIPPTGKQVTVRSMVVWHFRGDELQGETVFFDTGSIAKQLGAEFALSDTALSD